MSNKSKRGVERPAPFVAKPFNEEITVPVSGPETHPTRPPGGIYKVDGTKPYSGEPVWGPGEPKFVPPTVKVSDEKEFVPPAKLAELHPELRAAMGVRSEPVVEAAPVEVPPMTQEEKDRRLVTGPIHRAPGDPLPLVPVQVALSEPSKPKAVHRAPGDPA